MTDKNKQYIRLIGDDWEQHTDKRAGQIHRVVVPESGAGWVHFENEAANIRSLRSTRYRAEYVPLSDPEHPEHPEHPEYVVMVDGVAVFKNDPLERLAVSGLPKVDESKPTFATGGYTGNGSGRVGIVHDPVYRLGYFSTRVLVEKGETAPKTVMLLADGTWREVTEG